MRISDWSSDVCSSDLPGTLDYQVFTLADDPYSYVFYESYVDADADERHRTGPVSGPIVARMVECIDDRGFAQEFWTPVAALDKKRSEEHTSELQSLMRISYAVFCLKKKKIQQD